MKHTPATHAHCTMHFASISSLLWQPQLCFKFGFRNCDNLQKTHYYTYQYSVPPILVFSMQNVIIKGNFVHPISLDEADKNGWFGPEIGRWG